MSENYAPKSAVGRWFNDRLPLLNLIYGHLLPYPTPKNLNYWWTFGGILTFCLVTQIITGLVLAMHYVADADLAFASVEPFSITLPLIILYSPFFHLLALNFAFDPFSFSSS